MVYDDSRACKKLGFLTICGLSKMFYSTPVNIKRFHFSMNSKMQACFSSITSKEHMYFSFMGLIQKRYLHLNNGKVDHNKSPNNPAAWFPLAREMKRRIIAHVGPTNSGKTHAALQRLKASTENGGTYCAPLRLLAMEMYDRLNAEGFKCALVTGEAILGPKISSHLIKENSDSEDSPAHINFNQHLKSLRKTHGSLDNPNMIQGDSSSSSTTLLSLSNFDIPLLEGSTQVSENPSSFLESEKWNDQSMDSLKSLFGYNSSLKQKYQNVPFLACTVEMADYAKRVGVAVIDEIQMMSDPERGWAFTHALLGLPAMEVHVCGEPAIIPLLKEICSYLGESLEIHSHYKRLVPLNTESKPLGIISKDPLSSLPKDSCGSFSLRKGDCVIAFSRRSIFMTKRSIEMQTGRKVAIIYGTLPLESRTIQARLFNDPESEYDVLLATDAIGMGLNLNIKRIIFSTLLKYDGSKKVAISPQAIRQIAGRAGRFGSSFDEEGQVTAYRMRELKCISDTLKQIPVPYKAAGIFPLFSQMEKLAELHPLMTFHLLLEKFAGECHEQNSLFMLSSLRCAKKLSIATDSINLSLKDKYTIICAPVSDHDPEMMKTFIFYASHISLGKPCPIKVAIPKTTADTNHDWGDHLIDYESLHKTLNLYLWLSVRYPNIFVQKKEALDTSKQLESLIIESLLIMSENAIGNSRLTKKTYSKSLLVSNDVSSDSIKKSFFRGITDSLSIDSRNQHSIDTKHSVSNRTSKFTRSNSHI